MSKSNPPPKFEVSVTYSTVTPESAEEGDFADTGFVVEPEPATLEDVMSYAEEYGILPRTPGDWTDWWDSGFHVTDYGTGEETEYGLHVRRIKDPKGTRLDNRTFDRINKLLGGKAYRTTKQNPNTTRLKRKCMRG